MLKYIIDDFLIIVLVLGFLVLLFNNLKVDKKISSKIKILLLTITVVTISNILEVYYSTMDVFNYQRMIFSFICYSLRPVVVIIFISLLSDNKILKYFYGLSVVNTLIYSTCFFTDIAFGFSSDNHFYGGPFRFSTHVVCIIYLIVLIYLIIKKHNNQAWNKTIMLSFVTIITCIAAFLDFQVQSNLFDQTVLVCILLYYLFLYMEFNKIDALTNTFNRQSFYIDIDKYKTKITSVISIDMNNLKIINDTYGHLEGDNALISLSDVLLNSDKNKARIYRVGGDEFVILCIDAKEEKVVSIINKIKKDMKNTNYSCSIGYEMIKDYNKIYDSYKLADEKMYKEKAIFHEKEKKKK